MSNREIPYDAVLIAHSEDEFGFPCDVLEDTQTRERFVAYDPDVWQARAEMLALQQTQEETNEGFPTGA
jgi:hypothetical protein